MSSNGIIAKADVLCVVLIDRCTSAADGPVEMSRLSSGESRGHARRTPRVLQETIGGGDGILARNGQAGEADHGSTQSRQAAVGGPSFFIFGA
jgi:hypothetical protein